MDSVSDAAVGSGRANAGGGYLGNSIADELRLLLTAVYIFGQI